MYQKPVDLRHVVVLVVEDDSFMRQLIARSLTEIGVADVILAENGKDGLEKLQFNTVDMIFCDIKMPIMDGIEFLTTVRNHKTPRFRHTPVVILTGHGDQEKVKETVSLGIHGFLVKPFSKKALESRMVAAMTRAPISPETLIEKLADSEKNRDHVKEVMDRTNPDNKFSGV